MEGNSVQQGVEVTGANGKVVVVDEQGHPRTVVAGDQILARETVLTMDDGIVRVATEQSPTTMEANSVGVVTPNSSDAPSSVLTAALSETDLEIEALQQAIEAGADPTELFEAAAAGQQGGAGTTSFVEIARTGQQLLAESGFDTVTDGEVEQAGQAANTSSAPATASIELDANITADDIVNAAESEGVVLITGVVGGDVTDGDVVSLIVNGNTYTGIVLDDAFSIEVPGVDLAGDADKIIEASVTTSTGNQNGEATATDTEGYSVDTFVPTAGISLDNDITADDVISIEESGGNIVITGVVGGNVVDGDIVTLVINGNTFTGPVDGGTFSIDVPAADLVADSDQTIDASVVTTTGSINGEASASDVESYATDLVQPEAEIVLDSNIAFDGIVNAVEEAGVIAISGSVGADVEEGDVVTLFVNGSTFEGLVDSDLRFSIGVPGVDLVADTDNRIEASVTTTTGSVNGEATATDTETYGVDTEAPVATITLDANITADDIISQEESVINIPISGSVGGEVQVGDVVTLTINGNTYTGLVNEDLRFDITVSGADLAADSDSTIEASVTATDPAGNSLTATDTEDYGVDIVAPEASIILDANITTDDIVSVSEAAGNISVAGSVGGDVQQGDIVTLVINGRSFTGPVDESLRFSISVPGADLAADPDKTIEASVTTSTGDVNGEVTATDTETYGIETAPTVVSVRNDTEVEGDVDLVHLVTLSHAPSDLTSFSFSLSPISASNSDYGVPVFSDGVVLSGGSVLVPAGVGSFTVSIPTIEDSLVEDSETLSLSVGGVSAIGTIIDDDIPPVDENNDPLARSDSFSTQAETAITTGSVLSNDNLGDVPTAVVSSSSSSVNGGTVSYNGNGTFDYTPPSGFVGSDSFIYTIQDTDGQQSSATVTIVVGPVNNDPAAVADSYSTQEDTPVTTGNVLSNDDLGDTPTTVVTYDNSSANGGTVSYNNDGTFDYTPAANFNGTDTFTYTIEDADGQQSTATVTMTVSEGNDDPAAVADSYSTQEDTPVTTGNVLSNDDLGDTPTTVVTYDNSSANGGTVSYNNDGTFDYTPGAGFNGTDTFTYTIEDADGQQSTATVTMTVDRQNAAPDATDDPNSAPYSVQLGQFASDSSWSDASLSAFDANGNAATVGTYRAGNGFTNAKGVSGSQRTSVPVSKQIEFVEDTGTSESLVVQLNGNLTSATFAFSNLYANETDGAGGSNNEAGGWIAYYNGTEVASGQFSVNSGHAGTGSISAGGRVFNSVAFVAVDDGALRGDGYNDNSEYYLTGLEGAGPAAANSEYMTNEGQVLNINVAGDGLLANDSDSDLDAISVLSVNDSGTSGAVTVNADGTFEYDPGNAFDSLAVGEIATDTFDYTISDGNGGLDTATVTITVIGSSNGAQGNRLESDHYSSAADDILTGGDGADTFIWRDGDSGVDTVQNFDLVEDALDLSDLLQGATADSLDDYLRVGVSDEGDTSIDVVPLGDGSAPSQTVILDGVNLQDVYGTENSSLILANLVESNKLITE